MVIFGYFWYFTFPCICPNSLGKQDSAYQSNERKFVQGLGQMVHDDFFKCYLLIMWTVIFENDYTQ